jgi:hypothetical protein
MGKIKKGGSFLASGNNTCVYRPPVDCTDGSEIPEGHVSRIVPADSVEPGIQETIKTAFRTMDERYKKHFNLATKVCKAKFKEADLKSEDLTRECRVEGLEGQIKVGDTDLWNMLTPSQEADINKSDGTLYKDAKTTFMALKDLLHAIVEMNSYSVQVFHTDAHKGNVSWKGDIIVLHDWEKCTVRDTNQLNTINGTGGYDILSGNPPVDALKRDLRNFPCWVGILEEMKVFDIARTVHYPPDHKILHFSHEIFFRFWDLFSILVPVAIMFYDGETPLVEVDMITKLRGKLSDYFRDVFVSDLREVLTEPGRVLTEDVKRTKLDAITTKLHEVIETSFTEYAELLAAGLTKGGRRKSRRASKSTRNKSKKRRH